MRKLLVTLILVIISTSLLFAADGKVVGKVKKIDSSSGEIMISSSSAAESVKVGDKMYVQVSGKPIVMVSVYPMMSATKCRLAPGFGKYLSSIPLQSSVYRYTSATEAEINQTNARAGGSMLELAMLCGEHFQNTNVQVYLAKIGDGAVKDPHGATLTDMFKSGSSQNVEIMQSNDGYTYAIKSKGISVKFNQADILQEITLYAEGVIGFSKYVLPLPENLAFSDSRKNVEKKLGKPIRTGGQGLLPFWGEYPAFSIRITYWTESSSDMDHKIRFISIKKIVQ